MPSDYIVQTDVLGISHYPIGEPRLFPVPYAEKGPPGVSRLFLSLWDEDN
jgi:hypothetical protein